MKTNLLRLGFGSISIKIALSFILMGTILWQQGNHNYATIDSIKKPFFTHISRLNTLQDSKDNLFELRLLMFQLLGSNDQSEIDNHKVQITKIMDKIKESDLAKDLNSQSLVQRVIAEYDEVIRLHGDFQVKMAYQLIYGTSQKSHEEITALIHNKVSSSEALSNEELKQAEKLAVENTRQTTFVALGIAVFLAVFFSIIISLPIRKSVGLIQKLAQGNLALDKETNVAAVECLQRPSSNELTVLSRSTRYTLIRLRDMIGLISKNSGLVTSSVTTLGSASGGLVDNVTHMNEQAGVVAENSERLLETINTIASATEELTITSSQQNESVQELSRSVSEIAKNCEKEYRISQEASKQAKETEQVLYGLGKSAQQITKAVEFIKNIAAQTNLLALNATIEAARAGEAGRGFAVVAGEVKQLASQSAGASEEISRTIENIMRDTQASIKAMENTVSIIDDVCNTSEAIARVVEEQRNSASGISSAVEGMFQTTKEVAESTQVAATAASETAANILGIKEAIELGSSQIVELKEATNILATVSVDLEKVVGQFKI